MNSISDNSNKYNLQEAENDKYRLYIERLANDSSSEIFRNSGTQNAAIVFGNIFRKSNKEVRIFSGSMNHKLTNETYYLDNLVDFIGRGGKITILLEKEEGDHLSIAYKYLKKLSGSEPSKVSIKRNAGKSFYIEGDREGSQVNIHFCVGDNVSFRIETEKESHRAFGCFNNNELSQKLANIFDERLIQLG